MSGNLIRVSYVDGADQDEPRLWALHTFDRIEDFHGAFPVDFDSPLGVSFPSSTGCKVNKLRSVENSSEVFLRRVFQRNDQRRDVSRCDGLDIFDLSLGTYDGSDLVSWDSLGRVIGSLREELCEALGDLERMSSSEPDNSNSASGIRTWPLPPTITTFGG